MNQVLDNRLTDRTPERIAIEINSIKEQTRNVVLFNSIEIGRRLTEAKEMIEHGEWGKWLEESVNYSQSTAQNLMRIFEEYGSNQLTLWGDNAKSQALGNLSYTQAVILLGIPAEERETFIEEHDIENMTTRELQQAIKERDQALKEKEDIQKSIATLQKSIESKNDTIDKISSDRDRLMKEAADLKASIRITESTVKNLEAKLAEARENGSSDERIAELEKELKAAHETVEKLTEELNSPQVLEPSVITEVPEEIQKELDELREKVRVIDDAKLKQQNNKATVKFSVYFDTLVKGFDELLKALDEISEADPETHGKYKNAVSVLIGKMTEKL